MRDIGIIGGGVAGLAFATFLKKLNPTLSIAIFEKEERAGGWINTFQSPSGQLYETGPRSLRIFGKSGQAVEKLTEILKIDHLLVPLSSSSSSRFFFGQRGLVAVPKSFLASLTSPFGRRMWKSMLKDFVSKAETVPFDMSVKECMNHFFPSQEIEEAVEALVFGIWGCRSSDLSARFAFKELYDKANLQKSFVRGALSLLRYVPLKKRGFWTFEKGLQTLINTAVEEHFPYMFMNEEVLSVQPEADHLLIHTKRRSMPVKRVIFALPHGPLQRIAPEGIRELLPPSLPHSSIAVQTLGWKENLSHIKGFGALSSLAAEKEVLGCIFDSSSFAFHNSSMQLRLTIMLGGGKVPTIQSYEPDQLRTLSLDFLQRRFNLNTPPDESHLFMAKDALMAPPPFSSSKEHSLYGSSPCGKMFLLSGYFAGVGISNMIRAAEKLALDLND